jgi:phytoene synthase
LVRHEPDGQGRPRLTTNLDIVTADVKARDRDRYLSVLYAPAAVRPALLALHGLDLELAQVVASTSEPMLGEIRLAWWRDALTALDAGQVPAQPLLALIAAEVLPRGVSGAELTALEDRWLGLIGSDDVPESHFCGGGAFFALLARIGGGDLVMARRLGEAWAKGELAPGVVATPLRPLFGLVQLAARDAARARAGQGREPRGSTARQLRLLAGIVLGR